MGRIAQGESCTIPAGYDHAVVTNTDANRKGSYDIVIEENSTKKQIDAGETQRTKIYRNETTITNSGKAELEVEHCD